MKKFGRIAFIIILLIFGVYMIGSGLTKINGTKKGTGSNITTPVTLEGGFENCGTFDKPSANPLCFPNDFNVCAKAKLEMKANDNTTKISLTIFGMENDKCHYRMDVSGHGLDCLFNKSDLDDKLIDQMFGNDMGKKAIVDEACKMF